MLRGRVYPGQYRRLDIVRQTMRLIKATVRDFKSITEAEDVDLSEQIVCVVGKNESGKTAFLESLYRLKPLPTGHPTGFEPLRDYPRQRVLLDKDKIPSVRPITATFELDESDVDAIEKRVGPGVLKSKIITVSRKYETGDPVYIGVVTDEATGVRNAVSEHGLAPEDYAEIATVSALKAKLAEIEPLSEAQQELAAYIEEFSVNAAARAVINQRIPQFLYFDEYSELPGRISVP